jgi:hypothetical protein
VSSLALGRLIAGGGSVLRVWVVLTGSRRLLAMMRVIFGSDRRLNAGSKRAGAQQKCTSIHS